MIWVIILVFIILWLVFGSKNKQSCQEELTETVKAHDKKTIEENIDAVEKGVEIYSNLIELLNNNNELKGLVSSGSSPHFIIRERSIMIAIPLPCRNIDKHYWEEVYDRIQKKESDLCNYWIENISDCEELLEWKIDDDSLRDRDTEYAIVRQIGRMRKNDDGEYTLDAGTVVEEILRRYRAI